MIEHNIFDLKINEVNYPELLGVIENAINLTKKIKIGYTNPYIARLTRKDRNLKNVINDFNINHVDGTGISIAFRVIANKLVPRFNWTDYAFAFLSECERKRWSIFFLGSDQKTISIAVDQVKERYPQLKFAGFLNGYSDLNDESASLINNSFPDILWVGLGSPKQEFWVANNFKNLNCSVVQCVGDVYNYIAGNRLRGPKFLRKFGLEWVFRLAQNPIKYFNRYVVGIPYFFFFILIYKFKGAKKISGKN